MRSMIPTAAGLFLIVATVGGCAHTHSSDQSATCSVAERPAKISETSRGLNEPPDGFVALFNGHDLNSWRGRGRDYNPYKEAALSPEERRQMQAEWNADLRKHWRVDSKAGEIISDGKGVYLTTDRNYRDFEMYVDWLMVSPNGDSGIYLRTYPQVQIWDPNNPREVKNGAPRGSGGLWNDNNDNPGKWPLVKADKPVGQWNRFHIKMIGSRVWVWFNDQLTVDGQILDNYFDRSKPVLPTGPIELQTHGSEIRFRNIFLRDIPAAEANATLDKLVGDEGYRSLFNGHDLSGWAGPVDEYEVADGAIRCKPGRGGTLHTNEEFGDFEAKVEFKLPPAGNNGLAIRYPGTGDTAYVGMCELQVLDDSSPAYARLDPRQYCCSIYGVVPAHRGYLRPMGQWNFEHVTVKGHTIRVELNGTVVVDADVSKVSGDFMAGHAHPGLMRLRGSFGFAGHDDPVEFRNIAIKPLASN